MLEPPSAWLAHSVTLATESSLPRAAVPCESGCFFGTATIRGDDIVGAPPKSSLPPKRFSPRLFKKSGR